MKHTAKVFVLLLGLMLGCDKEEHISGADFQRQYELNNMQTVQWADYLGQKDGKAYLRIKTMSSVATDKWRERIVCADVGELDPAFARKLPQKKRE